MLYPLRYVCYEPYGCGAGEGFGEQVSLGHIREVDTIMHVLRCFEGVFIYSALDTANALNVIIG
ncbi:Obg-like ATPase 1 [Anaplasma phagocytophilum]|nr:Obg-like ATPase 1 [Anaplasma phagocytophilum]